MSIKQVLFSMTAIVGIAVSGNAFAEQTLNGEQVQKLFSGNTLHGAIEKYNISFDVYHAADGKIVGQDSKGRTHNGNWSVKGDELCQEWQAPSKWSSGCAKIISLGDELYSKRLPNGSAQYDFTISNGDGR